MLCKHQTFPVNEPCENGLSRRCHCTKRELDTCVAKCNAVCSDFVFKERDKSQSTPVPPQKYNPHATQTAATYKGNCGTCGGRPK